MGWQILEPHEFKMLEDWCNFGESMGNRARVGDLLALSPEQESLLSDYTALRWAFSLGFRAASYRE